MLIELDQSTLTRDARLMEWVQRIKQDDSSVVSRLALEVTPTDRFLVPELTTVRVDQWAAPNHFPPYQPAATIMQRLHDPAFAPILLEWTRTSPEPLLLEALALCGDEETAVQRAIPALNATISTADFRAFLTGVQRASELLLFMGNRKDPDLGKHIIRFTKADPLDRLARSEISLTAQHRQEKPFNVWQLRDSALLALTKSGHPDALKILQSFYKAGDIRERCVAAFALYSLSDDTGRELVDAYRRHEEESNPEIKERWSVDFAGGNSFWPAVVYLESPRLDEMYFERIERKFDQEDHTIATHPDFVARHRAKILGFLIARVEDPKSGVDYDVAHCLWQITREKFAEINGETSLAQRYAIAQQWKEYTATLPRK